MRWLYWNSSTWSSSDVIVMLNWRHHAKLHLSVFRDFWKFILKLKNSGEQEKEPIIRVTKDRKICPSGSPFVTTRQASWCQTAIIGTEFSILPSHSWWILAYSLLICCLHAAKSDFLATRSKKIVKIIITAELHFKTYNPLRIKVHL